MTHRRRRIPVQCEDTISVQCQDDQFGLDAEVVYDDKSFHLRRCTPFVTASLHGGRVAELNQDTAAGQEHESFSVNGQISAGFSTIADALGAGGLAFTDGVFPGFVALGDMEDNGNEPMNRSECYEEKHVHRKGKKRKARRGRRGFRNREENIQ